MCVGIAVSGLLASTATAATAGSPGNEGAVGPMSGTATTRQLHVDGTVVEALSETETFARLGASFAETPAVLVLDAGGAVVVGARVTFRIDGDAVFEPGPEPAERERIVATDWRGVATAPRVLAGEVRGTSVVHASTSDSQATVSFDYVTTGAPAVIILPGAQLILAEGQRARFDVALLDHDGLPVGGEVVTATLVGAPAGVVWPGGHDTLELRSDADGIVRFGESEGGTDTFTVTAATPPGSSFLLVLLTRAPGGVAGQLDVLVELGAA